MLSGPIRSALGPLIGSKIDFSNLHVDSGSNPSDEPSQFKPLREPEEPPGFLAGLLESSFDKDFQFQNFQNWVFFRQGCLGISSGAALFNQKFRYFLSSISVVGQSAKTLFIPMGEDFAFTRQYLIKMSSIAM